MKNLKKLSRKKASQINGGSTERCNEYNPCAAGWCCNGICSPFICME